MEKENNLKDSIEPVNIENRTCEYRKNNNNIKSNDELYL